MRAAAAALLAAALLAASPRAAPQSRIDRLEQWLRDVAQHEPGTLDAAAIDTASMTSAELAALWVDPPICTC